MQMRQVWRESARIFGQRPVLWLPVLVACLTVSILNGAAGQLTGWLALLSSRSVISRPTTFQIMLHSATISGPVLLVTSFIYVALYASALFTTVGMVRQLRSEQPIALARRGMNLARTQWRAVLLISLVGSGFVVLEMAIRETVFYLSVSVFQDWMLDHIQLWRIALGGLFTMLHCGEAWVLAATALRHIGAAEAREMTNGEVRQGRRLAIATVLVATALGLAMTLVKWMVIPEGGLDGTIAGWELGGVHSVITTFPYVLLFIGMTLLVNRDVGDIPLLPRIDLRTDDIGGVETGSPQA